METAHKTLAIEACTPFHIIGKSSLAFEACIAVHVVGGSQSSNIAMHTITYG